LHKTMGIIWKEHRFVKVYGQLTFGRARSRISAN